MAHGDSYTHKCSHPNCRAHGPAGLLVLESWFILMELGWYIDRDGTWCPKHAKGRIPSDEPIIGPKRRRV